MAQTPPDQNYYHHTVPHPHPHSHSHPHSHTHTQHPQQQVPPQFRNPFDLLFDDRSGAINYNYIRPYLPNQMNKPDELSESLVMRRPRRTRTTFTSTQIAELEHYFQQGRYLTPPRLADLSAKLALGTAQIKIWFKNRRRRHKIQSDQHRDFSYDGMPLSPTMPTGGSHKCTDVDPPSLQALSIGGGSATSNALTPSPTPSTTHLVEHYGESFSAYYNYSSHHNSQSTSQTQEQRHVSQVHSQYSASNGGSQFFPGGAMQQHEVHQQSQQHHQHHVMQQQQQQQQQYQHFDFEQKNANGCRLSLLKGDSEGDYSFNGSYYLRATSLPLSGVAAGESVTSALSPDSEVYEPLTPKNDESASLCNGAPATSNAKANENDNDNDNDNGDDDGGDVVGVSCATDVDADDLMDMDEGSTKKTTTTLQDLEPRKSDSSVADKSSDDSSDALSAGLLAVARGNLIGCGSNGSSAFGKFGKISMSSSQATSISPSGVAHETNQYQCTMDTIMQAYNPHRNAGGNTQFAFCFN